ncbi:hypothetical protein F4703DRAFT_1847374 [Phycomyces blakesleeanus]
MGGNFTATASSLSSSSLSLSSSVPPLGELKRPMLTMHSISSIRQLGFFIEHVGLYVYQSSFTLAKPDMPFIESLLHNDLLEGDIDSDVLHIHIYIHTSLPFSLSLFLLTKLVFYFILFYNILQNVFFLVYLKYI